MFAFAGEERSNVLLCEVNLVEKAIRLREMELRGERYMTLKEVEFVLRVLDYLNRHPHREELLRFATI